MTDKYDEMTADCNHPDCNTNTRAAIYLTDLAENDPRFHELLLAHAEAKGHPGDWLPALIDVCAKLTLTAQEEVIRGVVEEVKDLLLGEAAIQGAKREGGDPHLN